MAEEIKVKRFVTPEQLREDTTFTEADLNTAMLEQASLMAYYGSIAAEAQYQVDKFKQLVEIREAQAAKELRNEAVETGKKTTEKALEQEVCLNPVVIKHQRALNEAKQVYETLRIAVEALKQRKDMIIQFGVRHRMELETQGRISMRGTEGRDRVKETVQNMKFGAADK